MRLSVCLTASLVFAPATGWAEEPKAVIDKAVKAAGGEEKLASFKARTFKGKGKYYGMGEGIDYTGEWAVQHPDKMRMQISISVNGMTFTMVRVLNGDKLWSKMGDEATEAGKDEVTEAKEGAYAGSVTGLVPLKGKGFELTSLGEYELGGKKVVGIQVKHPGHRDLDLYFDRDKGLLVKSEYTVKDEMSGKEVRQETLYSDYKEVNGVQQAMKLVINRDDKAYVTVEIDEIDLKEKLDDALFAKP